MKLPSLLRIGFLLGLFAITGTGTVALIETLTRERIAANERAALQRGIQAVLPPTAYNNDLLADTRTVVNPTLFGTEAPVVVYRARRDSQPVAAILTPVAPDGYSGAIKLLVAIHYDGRLAGVRVISHHETPGLGDGIEADRSDWILNFNGRSLDNPALPLWEVKRDGGAFDQFTGATITPRAVVKIIRRTLQYFEENREMLFRPEEEGLDGITG
jgi:Na+-translocating ferredoxin:NAD+ oxidoreductase subunit G